MRVSKMANSMLTQTGDYRLSSGNSLSLPEGKSMFSGIIGTYYHWKLANQPGRLPLPASAKVSLRHIPGITKLETES